MNFLYRRRLSHLSLGFTSYWTVRRSSQRSSCSAKVFASRLRFFDDGLVTTWNGFSARSRNVFILSLSLSDSSGGCAGDLISAGAFCCMCWGVALALPLTGAAEAAELLPVCFVRIVGCEGCVRDDCGCCCRRFVVRIGRSYRARVCDAQRQWSFVRWSVGDLWDGKAEFAWSESENAQSSV